MSIVCGTDFSEPASEAVRVAAMLAARVGERLKLVHVIDEVGSEVSFAAEPGAPLYESLRTKLHAEARRARELGAAVDVELVPGHAAEVLTSHHLRPDARLVVVSSLGTQAPARWLLGSVSERVARASHAPVLVVRSAAPFEMWLRGERPLAVMVGVDRSDSSDAALRWVRQLRQVAPCDVTLAQLGWAPREHDRLGVGSVRAEQLHPEVEKAITRELQTRARDLDGRGDVRCVVRGVEGRLDQDLVALAEGATADLLVVGMQRRSGVERLWHGSVSRGVLHLAPMSVACVPTGHAAELRQPPSLEQVLVATDFTAAAARALPLAVALLPNGGTIHLVHVLTPALGQRAEELLGTGSASTEEWLLTVRDAYERLEQLIPESAAPRGIRVIVNVLQGDAADEVCRAAERLAVDVICIGSRGRPSVSAALLGSVAHGIVARSRRPVLVVPPRER